MTHMIEAVKEFFFRKENSVNPIYYTGEKYVDYNVFELFSGIICLVYADWGSKVLSASAF